MPSKKDKSGDPVADEAAEKGYIGTVPDPTPNEAYTLHGVAEGQPTPETDRGLRKQAEEAADHSGEAGEDGGDE